MTIRINSAQEALYLNTDLAGPDFPGSHVLQIQSQWSREPEGFILDRISQNDRYTVFLVDFGADFKDTHKNGIYWARVSSPGLNEGAWFLLKIITEPGGGDGMTRYVANTATENRIADTYYRPNY